MDLKEVAIEYCQKSEKFLPNVLHWLLDLSNPSIRYRTLTEFLDFPHDSIIVLEAY